MMADSARGQSLACATVEEWSACFVFLPVPKCDNNMLHVTSPVQYNRVHKQYMSWPNARGPDGYWWTNFRFGGGCQSFVEVVPSCFFPTTCGTGGCSSRDEKHI